MKQEEVVSLMGEPHIRSDGPRVSISDRDPTRGKSILMGTRYLEAKDPASHAMVAFFLASPNVSVREPAALNSGKVEGIDATAQPVNWVYRPDLGSRKTGNVQDKSLIMVTFNNGQLLDAFQLSR